jgi:hypothetical protein
MQVGKGDDSMGAIRTEPVPVTRLTAVTKIEATDWAVELPHPVFLRDGDSFWVDGDAVCVVRPDGNVIRHEGEGYWLCR